MNKKKQSITKIDRVNHIYTELRDRICSLIYPPGTILKETDLSKDFDVSRTPIRQALQQLQFEGLVETKKAIGTVVSGFEFKDLEDAFSVRIEILEIIARLSNRAYTIDDISDMEMLIGEVEKLNGTKNIHAYYAICNKLNEILSRVIDNKAMQNICESLYYQTARCWFHLVEDLWEKNIVTLRDEIREEAKSMRLSDVKGVMMVRRNYILIFNSYMKKIRNNRL